MSQIAPRGPLGLKDRSDGKDPAHLARVRALPCVKDLRAFIEYQPETGLFFWRSRPRHLFKSKQAHGAWNTKYSGTPAFRNVKENGYLYGGVTMPCGTRTNIYAHRLAFAFVHGEWPSGEIDHINRDKADNRACNLRCVDRPSNTRNAGLRANNKSGFRGVHIAQESRPFVVQIVIDGKNRRIGGYGCMSAAKIARLCAEIRAGYAECERQRFTP